MPKEKKSPRWVLPKKKPPPYQRIAPRNKATLQGIQAALKVQSI